MTAKAGGRMVGEKGFFQETQEKLVARDPQTLAILVAIVIGFLTLAAFLFFSRKRRFGRGILFCGASDSGKTALLGQLITGKPLETYTSMKENTGVLVLNGKKPVNLVDIPGSERLRDNIFNNYMGSARGIVYVIDSASISKNIRDVTEFLFNILSKPLISSSRPSLLIACNKQDLGLVKGASVVQSMLEREMNALRVSRSNTLEGIDGEGIDHVFLGKPGKDFAFADLGMDVKFIEISAQDSDTLDELKNWIMSVA